jgi:hypothetical protein
MPPVARTVNQREPGESLGGVRPPSRMPEFYPCGFPFSTIARIAALSAGASLGHAATMAVSSGSGDFGSECAGFCAALEADPLFLSPFCGLFDSDRGQSPNLR